MSRDLDCFALLGMLGLYSSLDCSRLDGTMQVAVEGDISSEKVEELLSKSEVMECLEKVADQACEKLNKS